MSNRYAEQYFEDYRILKATISYAVRPDEEKLTQLKEMLKKDYHATEVILREEQRDDLLGGYILQVGDRIIDNTVKRAFDNLEKNLEKEQGVNDIISVLKSDISGFEGEFNEEEGGRILSLHDGIVSVSGISRAVYGEIVLFENGTKGLVQNIDEEKILCLSLGDEQDLEVGGKVIRTKRRAGIPVGSGILGRVVDVLGAPIDGEGEIPAEDWYVIEKKAPASLSASRSTNPWRPVSWPSTPCSPSEEASVS